MNPVKIYPSNPINLANGFKKFAIIVKRFSPFIPMFANSQITSPAGAAVLIALPNTNRVLSKMERIKILPNWGFLYGGNSSTKEEGIPFKIVFDSILEIINVKKIPNITINITKKVEINDAPIPCTMPAINIVAIDIKMGNLPIAWNESIC